jgi:hypothetical protein
MSPAREEGKELSQKEDTSKRNGIDTSEEKRNKAPKSFDRLFPSPPLHSFRKQTPLLF